MTDQAETAELSLRAYVERWVTGIKPEVLVERIANVFACVLALVWFWRLGDAHWHVVMQPGPQEPNEPAIWYTTWLLHHGRNSYTMAEMPGAAYYFGPLYNLLMLALKPVLGITYTSHRIFNAIFLAAMLVLLIVRMRRAGTSFGVALLLAVTYYALCVDNIMITARPDTLGAFLFMLGIFIPEDRGYRPWPTAIGLACAVVAFHCKGYFAVGAGATLLGLAMHRSKGAAVLAGCGFAAGLVVTTMLWMHFFPLYFLLLVDVQWGNAFININMEHLAWQNTVLVQYLWPALFLCCFALKDFILRYPWREAVSYLFSHLHRLRTPLVSPALPVLGCFLIFANVLVQRSLGRNQGATFTYYIHLLVPFLMLLMAGYATTPLRRIVAVLMLVAVVHLNLRVPERIDARAEYARLIERTTPHQLVLGVDVMTDILARQGKRVYADGNTIYLPSGFNGGPFGRKQIHKDLQENYEAFMREIAQRIQDRTLDMIVTHDNDTLYSFMPPIRENYEKRGSEIILRYAFGGSNMQFWYPKPREAAPAAPVPAAP